MTLIRALPELSQHTPPLAPAREQLQRLEALAQQELHALLQGAPDVAPPSPNELTSLAWDLGLAEPPAG